MTSVSEYNNYFFQLIKITNTRNILYLLHFILYAIEYKQQFSNIKYANIRAKRYAFEIGLQQPIIYNNGFPIMMNLAS
jgi:hypothetical protein